MRKAFVTAFVLLWILGVAIAFVWLGSF